MKTKDDRSQWLLLDVPGAPGVVEALKERYAHYLAYNLFEGTPFQGLAEVAPRLLQLAEGCPLSRLSQANPSLWPGLFLHTRAPVQALLAHLRQILMVGFDEQHRGLLSYYNPQTASYVFDSSDPRELSGWLGSTVCTGMAEPGRTGPLAVSAGSSCSTPGLRWPPSVRRRFWAATSSAACRPACWSATPISGAAAAGMNTTGPGVMCRRASPRAFASTACSMAGCICVRSIRRRPFRPAWRETLPVSAWKTCARPGAAALIEPWGVAQCAAWPNQPSLRRSFTA